LVEWIFKEAEKRLTGLSPHYPLLYSIVAGLETKVAFEFGTGISTKVILEALKLTNGKLYSISTNEPIDLKYRYDILPDYNWKHCVGKSIDMLSHQIAQLKNNQETLDFVLHDGAHDYKTVLFDLQNIIPLMKQSSILLVHDTLHSKCGVDMRGAINQALFGVDHEKVTLPFGFGLDIIKINTNNQNGKITIIKNKKGSRFITDIL
jgi:predicted O-methyltransferase YrrM